MIYIPTTSTSAAFHFALEELIMENGNPNETYFMLWRTNPTLMIGRYQNTLQEINLELANKEKLEIIRRNSGGGTIFTDMGGWQFSFITKNDNSGFERFIEPVLTTIKALGLNAQFSGRNDLTVENKKFSGNARFVYNNRLLHHGSILFDTDLSMLSKVLNVDKEKYLSKGVKSVAGRVTNLKPYLHNIKDSTTFGEQFVLAMTKEFKQQAYTDFFPEATLLEQKLSKFNSWEWNFGKSPKFNFSRSIRCAGGRIITKMEVHKGEVKACHFEGDFFTNDSLTALEKKIIGTPFEKNALTDNMLALGFEKIVRNITVKEIIGPLFDA